MVMTLEDAMSGKQPSMEDYDTGAVDATPAEETDTGEPGADETTPVDSRAQDEPAETESAEEADPESTPDRDKNFKGVTDALKTVSKERNDWKGKAERQEGELTILRQQAAMRDQQVAALQQQMQALSQQIGGGQAQQADPDPADQLLRLINESAQSAATRQYREHVQRMSYAKALQAHGQQECDDALALLQQVVRTHPQGAAIEAAVLGADDPWHEVFEVRRRHTAMQKLGTQSIDDFIAKALADERDRLKAEIEAEIAQRQPAQPNQSKQFPSGIPRSQASQRSSAGGANGVTYAGPPTLESLIGSY